MLLAVYRDGVAVGAHIRGDEYLRTAFRPDCDFIGGEILERNSGERKHSYTQGEIVSWLTGGRTP